MNRNKVLGKGLSALLQGSDLPEMTAQINISTPGSGILKIPLEDIAPNPHQPRKTFNDNSLYELSESITQVGVLQPILVQKPEAVGMVGREIQTGIGRGKPPYQVVAGERRLRAARLAGLAEIPAIVCTYAQTEALKIALLENIQREDLGPVEEAEAYRGLMDAYGATQEELAAMLGKKRSSVANLLRLLTLEPEILVLLQDGGISRGHAKALLGLPPGPARVQLAKLCQRRDLSVRDCERRVRAGGVRTRRKRKSGRSAAPHQDPIIRALNEKAEQVYGSPVHIDRDPSTGKGSISVRFYSDSDLERVLKIMGVDPDLG